MTSRTTLQAAVAMLAVVLLPAIAHAQIFRAYVASDGNDGNPCTLPQPCRLLPAALAAVASGGEIWLLDSANYNTATVTLDKSVSILAVPGAVGSVVAAGGPAITISSPGLSIALRNLVIVPLPGGLGTHGVRMFANSELVIEDSLIANIADSNHGVFASGPGRVRISGTTFRKFGDGAIDGAATGIISQTNGTGTADVTLSSSSVTHTSQPWVQDNVGSAVRSMGNNHFANNGLHSGDALGSLAAQ